jgi:hypothetical protein
MCPGSRVVSLPAEYEACEQPDHASVRQLWWGTGRVLVWCEWEVVCLKRRS